MPATMNAANEIAVEAFLNGGIRFTDIAGDHSQYNGRPSSQRHCCVGRCAGSGSLGSRKGRIVGACIGSLTIICISSCEC